MIFSKNKWASLFDGHKLGSTDFKGVCDTNCSLMLVLMVDFYWPRVSVSKPEKLSTLVGLSFF